MSQVEAIAVREYTDAVAVHGVGSAPAAGVRERYAGHAELLPLFNAVDDLKQLAMGVRRERADAARPKKTKAGGLFQRMAHAISG